MATVYLHIGQPKTASSALQLFFTENRKLLAKNHVYYPESTDFLKRPFYHKNRNGVWVSLGYQTPEYDSYIAKLEKLCRRYRSVLFSDEGFYQEYLDEPRILPELYGRLKALGIELKVIVYLRRQDDYVYSLWGQKIKRGRPEDLTSWIDRWIRDGECDYYDYLERLSADIGKENVIAKVYDRNLFKNGSIFADFLDILGLELTDRYVMPLGDVNESLVGSALETKRKLNLLSEFFQENDQKKIVRDNSKAALRVKDLLFNVQAQLIKEERLTACDFFSTEERCRFVEQFEEGNRKTAEKYMGFTPGTPLFATPVSRGTLPPSRDELDGEVMYILLRIISLQDKLIAKTEQQYEALKEEVRLPNLPAFTWKKIRKTLHL